jgi:hypothetical protein
MCCVRTCTLQSALHYFICTVACRHFDRRQAIKFISLWQFFFFVADCLYFGFKEQSFPNLKIQNSKQNNN